MALRNPPPKSDESTGSESKGGLFLFLFSLPFLLLGGATLLQTFGGGEFIGRALAPNWVLGTAGLVFFGGGLAFMLRAMGAGDSAGRVFSWVILLALATVFHYGVFVADLSGWSGSKIWSLSAGQSARIFVGTIDLFVVLNWVATRTTFIGDKPAPLWKKLDELEQ